ncbi:hypothetical protein AUSSIE_3 [Sinorhizobium phage Aussie]|nr:hypothetical protein AUSSIE_3 [Sinorhizobium phage Aussie]
MTTVVFPARAAQALGYLKSHSNDVDIYVEDTSSPNMWVKLLKRYLPSTVRLTSVSSLGNRSAVLAACKADQSASDRRRLYIIDADVDLLLGSRKPNLKHLYRLRRYCVENYLLNQVAVVETLTSLNPNLSEVAAANAVDMAGWFARNGDMIRELFVCYAVSQSLSAEIKTVAYSCYQLFQDNTSFDFCPAKVRRRILSVYRETARRRGIASVRSRHSQISRRVANVNPEIFCSAKCYILPSIFEIAKKNAHMSATKEVFKTILASYATPFVDKYLQKRLAAL